MKGVKNMFVYQGNESDCGFASLKMLLANANKDRNYLYLRKPATKKERYSFQDLIDIGKENDVPLLGYKIQDPSEILKEKHPFLATIRGKTADHLVYVKKVGEKFVQVYDPQKGKEKMKVDEFLSIFEGNVIEIDYEMFTKHKCEQKKKRIIPPINELLLAVLQIGSLVTVLIALSTIANKKPFIMTMILLFVYVLFEAAHEFFLKQELKKFDLAYLPTLKKLKKNRIGDAYTLLNEEKKNYFKDSLDFITSTIIFIAIAITFFLNGPVYLYTMLVLSFFVAIIYVSVDKFLKGKNKVLCEEEKKIISGEDEDYTGFVEKTYSIISYVSLKKFLTVLLSLLASVLLMLLTNNRELNFVLFYFFMFLFAIDKLQNILDICLNQDKKERVEAKFRDIFLE